MNSHSHLSEAEFHKLVRSAWEEGRTIVPIIGAGASADSGFPPLASVVRYVAKLACYLKHKFFLPVVTTDVPFRGKVDEFTHRIDKYVQIFGWPDRFQLNADLRGRLQQPDRWNEIVSGLPTPNAQEDLTSRGKMDFALCLMLDELAEKINPVVLGLLMNTLVR